MARFAPVGTPGRAITRDAPARRAEERTLDAEELFRDLPDLAAQETLRAFVAIDIPESLRERCAEIEERLARHAEGVSWVRAANLHLTLKFLGAARPAQLLRLVESLAHKAAKVEPFEVEIAGLGCFPSPRRARVIWAGVGEGGEALRAVAEKVAGAAVKAGFPRESRPFSAHLTLGRVRMAGAPVRRAGRQGLDRAGGTRGGDLSDLIAREDPGVLERFRVSEIVLMYSRLHPAGAVHTPIHRIPLGRGETR